MGSSGSSGSRMTMSGCVLPSPPPPSPLQRSAGRMRGRREVTEGTSQGAGQLERQVSATQAEEPGADA
eukprot:3574321-Rhodomonas_salina.2